MKILTEINTFAFPHEVNHTLLLGEQNVKQCIGIHIILNSIFGNGEKKFKNLQIIPNFNVQHVRKFFATHWFKFETHKC